MAKTGVFICRCGDNIAGVVDVYRLAQKLAANPEVGFVECHDLLCSPAGKAFLCEKMQQHKGERAVVAACSPKDHERTFQKCLENAGLNKFLLQMANVREHCTWVTEDREAAFAKAVAMTQAAINRVHFHEALAEQEIECNTDLVVLGGGIAGIEAALLAAQAGRKVTLIDRAPSIGGLVTQFEEVAPHMECSPCMLSPRLDAVEENDNITVLSNAQVTQVLGYLGKFEVTIKQVARFVELDLCIGCDECIQACPITTSDPYQHGLADRKAVYVPFPGCYPNAAAVDRSACQRLLGTACQSCVDACPVEAMNFAQKDRELQLTAGAIVVATGATAFAPHDAESFGFGLPGISLPNVLTLAQFERLGSNHGPTGGKIVGSDGTAPSSIAFVHCVGRQELGYCSGVCCQAAIKNGLLARTGEQAPGQEAPKILHLHTDQVMSGRLATGLLNRAQEAGCTFVSIKPAVQVEVAVAGGDQRLQLSFQNIEGHPQQEAVDMVVLATGLVPSSGTAKLAKMLAVLTDDSGFLAPDHPLLRPAQSSVEGIYIAGTSAGPKGIADSIAQAQAAAGAAVARLQPGAKLKLEVMTAHTKDELCSKCQICVAVCPYSACSYRAEQDAVVINDVLCHGCGSCVAACASGAAEARHFTDRQLEAEIAEVLDAADTREVLDD